ncbi:MAG: O-antigen ligase family protein [Pirellulales bacterium]
MIRRPAKSSKSNAAGSGGLPNSTLAAIALIAAVLMIAVILPADSTSVFDGQSLPLVLMIFVTAICSAWAGELRIPQRRDAALMCALAGVVVLLFISSTAADLRADGRVAWNSFWHLIGAGVFMWTAVSLCRRPFVARLLLLLLIGCGVYLCVQSVVQIGWTMPEARAEYRRNPDAALAAQGLDAPPGSALRAMYESRLDSTEPTATFALTNSLAALLTLLIFPSVGLFLFTLRSKERVAARIGLAAVLCVAMSIILFLTKSRTAYLACIAGGAAWGMQSWMNRRRSEARGDVAWKPPTWIWPAGALLIVIILGAAIQYLASDQLILSEAPKSIAFRLEYWQGTARMVMDYPWTGVGMGNFQSYYPAYKLPLASESIADPHNWLLDLCANSSIPLAVIIVGLVVITLVRIERVQRIAEAAPQEDAASATASTGKVFAALFAVWIVVTTAIWLLSGRVEIVGHCAASIAVSVWLLCNVPLLRDPNYRPDNAAPVGLIALLLCLLATGSWQASGILIPMLTLAALSLHAPASTNASTPDATSMTARMSMVVGIMLVIIAFVLQTWVPVMNSWAARQESQFARTRNEALAKLESAATIDPCDSSHRVAIVQFLVSGLRQDAAVDVDRQAEQLRTAVTNLLDSNSAGNLTWKLAADAELSLAAVATMRFGESEDRVKESLARADRYIAEALARYPSSIQLMAQAALVKELIGDHTAAANAARQVIAFSDRIPHLDKKLEQQMLWLPQGLEGIDPTLIQRPDKAYGLVRAEPICQGLAGPSN